MQRHGPHDHTYQTICRMQSKFLTIFSRTCDPRSRNFKLDNTSHLHGRVCSSIESHVSACHLHVILSFYISFTSVCKCELCVCVCHPFPTVSVIFSDICIIWADFCYIGYSYRNQVLYYNVTYEWHISWQSSSLLLVLDTCLMLWSVNLNSVF